MRYHIHVDAMDCSDELMALLPNGFYEMPFIGHPQGWRHFEPNHHLTFKCATHEEFLSNWVKTEEGIRQDSKFRGYLEGEFVPFDDTIVETPYVPDVPIPFQITRRQLVPGERFRKTEIHLTLDKDRSDPQLIENLLQAGFYGAYLPKAGYTALVLTIQAVRRPQVIELTGRLRNYLDQAGGVVQGTLKEEVIIDSMVVGITAADLPEVIDYVDYL